MKVELNSMLHQDLYNIDFLQTEIAVITLCDKNHPIFKAHFPSYPILPAFMHFEIISNIFGLDITTIKKAKFTKVISHSETIRYERKNNVFNVFCQDEKVASFSI